MRAALGCIADDITGAGDLAGALRERGVATRLVLGVPTSVPSIEGHGAVVIALKSRTAPVATARRQTVASARWLRAAGCSHAYVKYCSTFDSTAEGNIGPATDAVAGVFGDGSAGPVGLVLHSPAYPATGRTVYQGHLFVGDRPLHETGMRAHPLTPMTDSDVVRLLRPQTPHEVGLLDLATQRDEAHLHARLDALEAGGCVHVVADAVDDDDLDRLARAAIGRGHRVSAGGAALGAAVGTALATASVDGAAPRVTFPAGPALIVCGSASQTTRRQLETFVRSGGAMLQLDARDLVRSTDVVETARAWAMRHWAESPRRPVLVGVDARPESVADVQAELGTRHASAGIEAALGAVAADLVARGATRVVVAGGETSGAVCAALGVHELVVGPLIAPGVPWTVTPDGALALALKSGNFGGDDFFDAAFAQLDALDPSL